MDHPIVHVEYPPWVDEIVDFSRAYKRDDDRMRVAIGVASANVERATGGPFGAAIRRYAARSPAGNRRTIVAGAVPVSRTSRTR